MWLFKVFKKSIKSFLRFPKLRIWVLRGWGRCLKVTLQISAHGDGGPSGGSSVRRPGSEDPIGEGGNVPTLVLPILQLLID